MMKNTPDLKKSGKIVLKRRNKKTNTFKKKFGKNKKIMSDVQNGVYDCTENNFTFPSSIAEVPECIQELQSKFHLLQLSIERNERRASEQLGKEKESLKELKEDFYLFKQQFYTDYAPAKQHFCCPQVKVICPSCNRKNAEHLVIHKKGRFAHLEDD